MLILKILFKKQILILNFILTFFFLLIKHESHLIKVDIITEREIFLADTQGKNVPPVTGLNSHKLYTNEFSRRKAIKCHNT